MSDTQIRNKAGMIWKDYSGCQIFSESVDLKFPNGKYLARFRKNMLDLDVCQLGFKQYIDVGLQTSNNRGNAAGRFEKGKKTYRTFDSSSTAIFETDSISVNSGIMGYMDSPNWRNPCRQTAFTKSHFEQYQKGLPFIKAIDKCYQELMPLEYDIQKKEVVKSNYHIEDTVFSTVTVNGNFQTGLHKDSGDFKGGFGNLIITERGKYQGGFTLFPQFGVGFDCRMTDYLAMDVHQWHCNTPIKKISNDGFRLSFVCYLRQRMHQCPMLDNILPSQVNLSTKEKIDQMIKWSPNNSKKAEPEIIKEDLGIGNYGHKWYQLTGPVYIIKYYNTKSLIV